MAPSFERANWPLHLTIVGNFCSRVPTGELVQILENLTSRTQAFIVTGRSREMFGPHNDIPVTEVAKTEKLLALHKEILNEFADKIKLKTPHYSNEGYRPHITDQITNSISPGTEVKIDSISLVDMTTDEGRVLVTLNLQF